MYVEVEGFENSWGQGGVNELKGTRCWGAVQAKYSLKSTLGQNVWREMDKLYPEVTPN